MTQTLRSVAFVLGFVGVLLCLAAIAVGWYAAVNSANRIERAADRLDRGLWAVDAPLARVELKVTAVHAQLDGVRTAAVAIAAENPALPRVKEAIDQLVARLVSGVEQAETLADSLRSQAAGIRAAAEFVEHFHVDEKVTRPLHAAADKIDQAANALDGLRGQIEELKVAKAIDLTNKVLGIAAKALAGTDALASGVSSAREGRSTRKSRFLDLPRRRRKHHHLALGQLRAIVVDRLGATGFDPSVIFRAFVFS
jgi:hypothetical protein